MTGRHELKAWLPRLARDESAGACELRERGPQRPAVRSSVAESQALTSYPIQSTVCYAMSETQQKAFRFPASLVERLDRYVKRSRASRPGEIFTRSDAVRMLLAQALDASEQKGSK